VFVGVRVGTGEGVAVGVEVEVAEGGTGLGVEVGGSEVAVGGWGVGEVVGTIGVPPGVSVPVGTGVSSLTVGRVVGDGPGVLRLGVRVGSSVGGERLASVPSAIREARLEGINRRLASQPPNSKAVTASQTKIEIRARRARLASSSLRIGKMALWASRLERKATRAAITVAPMLRAARIRRMVGKGSIWGATP
jgi:hypothetical protein